MNLPFDLASDLAGRRVGPILAPREPPPRGSQGGPLAGALGLTLARPRRTCQRSKEADCRTPGRGLAGLGCPPRAVETSPAVRLMPAFTILVLVSSCDGDDGGGGGDGRLASRPSFPAQRQERRGQAKRRPPGQSQTSSLEFLRDAAPELTGRPNCHCFQMNPG